MENYRILAQMPEDKLNEILYNVRIAINEILEQGFNEKEIQIAVPKYFVELLNLKKGFVESYPLMYLDGEFTFFGYRPIWNYDNYIVVYHVDMPLYLESTYKVINLK